MSESKIKEIDQVQLASDRKACLEEIKPILEKYNLDIGAVITMVRNGILAIPELIRRQPKPASTGVTGSQEPKQ